MTRTTAAARDTKQGHMKVVAYLRVSTDRQAKDGYGLDDQERQIRQWCRVNGHKLVRVIADEGKSGTLEAVERPGLLDVLKAIKNHEADGVIMRDLDRIARTLTVQEAVLAQIWNLGGHAFISTDAAEVPQDDPDDPMRTAMRQMAGVFAQLERAMLVKRMKNGRAAKRDQGRYAGDGSPAFGTRAVDKELADDDHEQTVIKRMKELRTDGLSYAVIAKQLNTEGLTSKRGGAWHAQTVSRVLARTQPRRTVAATRKDIEEA